MRTDETSYAIRGAHDGYADGATSQAPRTDLHLAPLAYACLLYTSPSPRDS